MAAITIHFGRVRQATPTIPNGVLLRDVLDRVILLLYASGRIETSCAFSLWRKTGPNPPDRQQVDESTVTVGDMAAWFLPNEVWVVPNDPRVDP